MGNPSWNIIMLSRQLRRFISTPAPALAETAVRDGAFHGHAVKITTNRVPTLDFVRYTIAERRKGNVGGAFTVLDIDVVGELWDEWRQQLPGVEVFYARKCNSDALLSRVLATLGASFDCASPREILEVFESGVHPRRILYANTHKCPSHLQYAMSAGVTRMTLDSVEELHKIASVAPGAKILIRIAVANGANFDCKFGADPVKEAPAILEMARDMGLDIEGVSFHVGTRCDDKAAYRRGLKLARAIIDLGRSRGHSMSILDIGGGFPGRAEEGYPTFEEVAAELRSALKYYAPEGSGLRTIAEPGRYFACSTTTLASQVVASKMRITSDSVNIPTQHVILDQGIFSYFHNRLYEGGHTEGIPAEIRPGSSLPTTLWGPTCDAVDVVEKRDSFPPVLAGDFVVFPHIGAYSAGLATPFNGFGLPDSLYFASEKMWRRLEKEFVRDGMMLCRQLRRLYSTPAAALVDAAVREGTLYGHAVKITASRVPTQDFIRYAIGERRKENLHGAFTVLDVDVVGELWDEWQEHLPGVEVFYARKCNADDLLCRVLATLGASFDCASTREIQETLHSGVPAERIIYANSHKCPSHLQFAMSNGVTLTTLDSVEELRKIAEKAPGARIILRIAGANGANFDSKFGSDPVKEAPAIIEMARDLGLDIEGVSFHVGTRCNDITAFRRALKLARETIDLGRSRGHSMSILDIGGGFPGRTEQGYPTFREMATVIRSALKDYAPEGSGLRTIAEPGNTPTQHVILDQGMRTYFHNRLYEGGHMEGVPAENLPGPPLATTLWGPTCTALDVIENHSSFPPVLAGDFVVFPHIGAYSAGLATPFNGFGLPDSLYFASEAMWKRMEKEFARDVPF